MRTTPPFATLVRAALPLAAFTAVLTGCQTSIADEVPPPAEAAPLHEAVDELTNTIVYDILSPPQASRVYAYASIAAYEALRWQDTSFRSLAGQVNGLTPLPAPPADSVSFRLAGVHAFLTVGRQLTFSRERMDSLRTAMDERLRAGLSPAVFARSVAYGDTVAKHILAWSGGDGFLRSRGLPKYSVTSEVGRWVPTPPAYMDAVEPNWGTIRPFALDSGSQFRPLPPHPYDTARTSDFHREALEVYEAQRTLTEEQRAITAFWDCNPYVMHVQGHTMYATKKITPGGHWIAIVGIASRKADLGMVATAEAYARTSMGLADGFIASWDEKFRSNVVRPETYINAHIDERWQPLLQTPPFPEYTSGHSVISTAAATVLTDLFGDGFAFADSAEMDYGLPVREFTSFNQAAAEAAISRLYGGIHYRRAIEQGIAQGRAVGEQLVRRVHTRPPATIVAGGAAGAASAPATRAAR